MLRDFNQQVVQHLWKEGFTNFIDFSSGLPTNDQFVIQTDLKV